MVTVAIFSDGIVPAPFGSIAAAWRLRAQRVMATVLRIRWFLTARLIELALRIVFLVSLFTRPAMRRLPDARLRE